MRITTLRPGHRAICILLLCVASLSPAAFAADWPGWRGPHHDGICDEANLKWSWPATGPEVRWRAEVGKGFSSVAVAQGRVYTLGNRDEVDTVYCLDAQTGDVIWKHAYPSPLQPIAYEGGPGATPVVAGGRVYTLGKSGDCFCLDGAKGSVIWSKKFAPPPTTRDDYKVWWGFAGSPLLEGDRVILPVGTAGVALNKLTGEVLWDNGPGRPGYSSPVAFMRGGERCFALLSGHEALAVRIRDGKILWRIPWRTTWDQNAADVLVDGGRMLISTGHGVGCALFDITGDKPAELWRNKNLKSELATPVLWRGHVYGFNEKKLCCLDWATGELKWSAPDTRQGSFIVVDGKLLALQENGELLVADAVTGAYQPLTHAQVLKGRCWSAPVLADGRIYARNALGTLVCIDVR